METFDSFTQSAAVRVQPVGKENANRKRREEVQGRGLDPNPKRKTVSFVEQLLTTGRKTEPLCKTKWLGLVQMSDGCFSKKKQ